MAKWLIHFQARRDWASLAEFGHALHLMAVLAGKLKAWRDDCAPAVGKSTLTRLELSQADCLNIQAKPGLRCPFERAVLN